MVKKKIIITMITAFLFFSIFKVEVFADDELTSEGNDIEIESTLNGDENLDNEIHNKKDDEVNADTNVEKSEENVKDEANEDNNVNQNTNYGWVEQNDSKYYYDCNGQKVYGKKEIDGMTYYFDTQTGALVKGKFINIEGKLYYFGLISGTLQKNGWYYRDNFQYYLDTITGEVAIGLKNIDGYSYFFNEKGVMQKGKFKNIDGKIYYFGATSGKLQKSGWYEKDGAKYYLDKQTGEVYTGEKIIEGKIYNFDSQGKLRSDKITGLVTIDEKTYYYDENGNMVKGKFIQIDNKLYYFGATSGTLQKTGWYRDMYYLDPRTGEVAVGLKEISNKQYYFSKSGVIQKGKAIVIDNNLYYFNKTTGEMVKGHFITVDNRIYYFGAISGTAQKSGWYTKEGQKYYLDPKTGEVYTGNRIVEGKVYSFDERGRLQGSVKKIGLVEIDGKTYYFDNNGDIVKGKMITIDGNSYYFNSTTGVMVKGAFIAINGKFYYFGAASGKLQKTGWYENYGSKYYLDKQTGEVYIGEKIIDGKTYYFDSNGNLQINYIKPGIAQIDGNTYYLDENKNIVKGQFIKVDGKLYYFGAASGTLQKTGWYIKNGKIYYLDKQTGEVYTSQAYINGKYYYFTGDGILEGVNIESEQEINTLKINGQTYKIDNIYMGNFITQSGKIYYKKPYSTGYTKIGWMSLFNDIYYSDKNTGEIYTGFHTIDGNTYYFNNKGILQKGLKEIDGRYYYFDLKNGALKLGEFYYLNLKKELYGIDDGEDEKLYYLGAASGTLQKSGWYIKNGNKYYIDKTTGEVYTGFRNIEGVMYWFDSNGILYGLYGTSDNLITEENDVYFINNIGEYVKGEFVYILENGKYNNVYYFGAASGKLQKTGWYTKNNRKYYLDLNTGKVYRGKCKINGKYYYFDSQKGILFKDTLLIEETQNLDYSISSVAYYFDEITGAAKTGWIESTKYKEAYYANENGELYKGISTIGNDKYLFDNQYALVKGWYIFNENDKSEYYQGPDSDMMLSGDFYYSNPENGKLYIGLCQMGDYKRYFNESGVLQINKDITLNGVNYHADKYGRLSIID